MSFTNFDDAAYIHKVISSQGTTPTNIFENRYVGDWQYLNLQLRALSAGVGGGYLVIQLTWTYDQDTFGITTALGLRSTFQHVEYYTAYAASASSDGNGFWCIPIKAPNLSVDIFRVGVNNVSGNLMAQLTMRTRPARQTFNNEPVLDYTAPNTAAGGNFSTISQSVGHGKAYLSGYVFNSAAGGATVINVNEINELGAAESLFYFQTPTGAVANGVFVFAQDIPLRGRAISVTGAVAGVGLGNAKVFISLYPED